MIEYDAISSRYTYPYIYIQFPLCTPQRWWMWLVPDLVWTFSALEAAPGWNWWGMWGLPVTLAIFAPRLVGLGTVFGCFYGQRSSHRRRNTVFRT